MSRKSNWRIPSRQKPKVVAAILQKDGKFLMGKRALSKKTAPGFWSPICGRLEANETPAQAVIREVFEEVGLVVRPIAQVDEFETHDKSALILWWTAEIISGEPRITNDENSELRWLSIEEMEKLDQVFSEDIELFKRIRK